MGSATTDSSQRPKNNQCSPQTANLLPGELCSFPISKQSGVMSGLCVCGCVGSARRRGVCVLRFLGDLRSISNRRRHVSASTCECGGFSSPPHFKSLSRQTSRNLIINGRCDTHSLPSRQIWMFSQRQPRASDCDDAVRSRPSKLKTSK